MCRTIANINSFIPNIRAFCMIDPSSGKIQIKLAGEITSGQPVHIIFTELLKTIVECINLMKEFAVVILYTCNLVSKSAL